MLAPPVARRQPLSARTTHDMLKSPRSAARTPAYTALVFREEGPLGIVFEEYEDVRDGRCYLVCSDLVPESQAESMGLVRGCVLQAIDGVPFTVDGVQDKLSKRPLHLHFSLVRCPPHKTAATVCATLDFAGRAQPMNTAESMAPYTESLSPYNASASASRSPLSPHGGLAMTARAFERPLVQCAVDDTNLTPRPPRHRCRGLGQ
jgi:hypothetical protein